MTDETNDILEFDDNPDIGNRAALDEIINGIRDVLAKTNHPKHFNVCALINCLCDSLIIGWNVDGVNFESQDKYLTALLDNVKDIFRYKLCKPGIH